MNVPYHYVAILVLQLKPQYAYWKLDFHPVNQGKGNILCLIRDSLARASGCSRDCTQNDGAGHPSMVSNAVNDMLAGSMEPHSDLGPVSLCNHR